MDEAFPCPVGVAFWEEYRREHLGSPLVPPDCSEHLEGPPATAYYEHGSFCDDCNEV